MPGVYLLIGPGGRKLYILNDVVPFFPSAYGPWTSRRGGGLSPIRAGAVWQSGLRGAVQKTIQDQSNSDEVKNIFK